MSASYRTSYLTNGSVKWKREAGRLIISPRKPLTTGFQKIYCAHETDTVGRSGAGKGTQAVSLSKNSNSHISTGHFRANIREGTELGLAKSYIDAGNLVPDDLTVTIVRTDSEGDCKNGFCWMGSPEQSPGEMEGALDS